MGRFEGIFAAFYINILEGCFFAWGKAFALTGRTVYIGASVLSGRAVIRLRKFQLHEFCVKFIKKMHGNVGYYKYFVTFALDYENMN